MTDSLQNPEIQKTANIEAFVKFLGDKAKDHFHNRLIEFWKQNGKEGAKRFCINDTDKFDDKDLILYLEKNLFEAGEEGLDKNPPWNTFKRRKAGLPMLFDYET